MKHKYMAATDNILPPSLGTELKINVTAELGNDLHLADVDFVCTFYSNNPLGRSVTIQKQKLLQQDDDNYIAVLNTSDIGTGEYWLKLTAYLPDTDFEDRLRTEIVRVPTGIRVIR